MVLKKRVVVAMATPGQASQLSFPCQYSTHQHSRDTCALLRCCSNPGEGRCSSSTPDQLCTGRRGGGLLQCFHKGALSLSQLGFGNECCCHQQRLQKMAEISPWLRNHIDGRNVSMVNENVDLKRNRIYALQCFSCQ